MVTPMLRELAGPFPPFFRLEEPWFLHDRSIRRLRDAWDHVCRQAIHAGSAEELHAARDDYQAVLLGHLKILDGYLMLLTRFESERPGAGFVELVSRTRDELQRHYESLFPRWQTLDDLEAILLERVSLPNDQLKALAAKYPPAQAWYDEASDTTAAQE